MAPYDDWNKLDDEEDEELQDSSVSCLFLQSLRFAALVCGGEKWSKDSVGVPFHGQVLEHP